MLDTTRSGDSDTSYIFFREIFWTEVETAKRATRTDYKEWGLHFETRTGMKKSFSLWNHQISSVIVWLVDLFGFFVITSNTQHWCSPTYEHLDLTDDVVTGNLIGSVSFWFIIMRQFQWRHRQLTSWGLMFLCRAPICALPTSLCALIPCLDWNHRVTYGGLRSQGFPLLCVRPFASWTLQLKLTRAPPLYNVVSSGNQR